MKTSICICSILLLTLAACKHEDPAPENIPELITDVVLTFLPESGSPVEVTATDPDGDGVLDLEVNGPIQLAKNTAYLLRIELINNLYSQGEEGYFVSHNILAEADEHMFFFAWSEGVFSDPSGDGNIDNRNDPLKYVDFDANLYPLGLETRWTTGNAVSSKSFRVLLKHQPGSKSAASGSSDGESDLDVSFVINVNG